MPAISVLLYDLSRLKAAASLLTSTPRIFLLLAFQTRKDRDQALWDVMPKVSLLITKRPGDKGDHEWPYGDFHPFLRRTEIILGLVVVVTRYRLVACSDMHLTSRRHCLITDQYDELLLVPVH